VSDEAVGWGVIGASGWAARTFAPAVAAAPGARLVALASRDAERAAAVARRLGARRGHRGADALAADREVEAVWVASPPALHREHALAALAAGKHVLVEKPLAATVADAQAIVDAARRAGRHLAVGYPMRQHPRLAALAADWHGGAFGRPVALAGRFFHAFRELPADWKRRRASSGGWALHDVGIHLVDLARWFLGEPRRGAGLLASPRFGLESDDLAHLTLAFEGGVVATLEASTGAGGPPPRFEIYGTDGWAVADGFLLGAAGRLLRGRRGEEPRAEEVAADDLYRRQVSAFSRLVRGGDAALAGGDDGLAGLAITQRLAPGGHLVSFDLGAEAR